MNDLHGGLMSAGLLLAAVLTFWLTGAAIVTGLLLGRERTARIPAVEFHGLSLLMGIGGVSWLSFLWSASGGPLGRTGSVIVGAAGGLLGVVAMLVRRRRDLRSTTSTWSRFVLGALACLWISLLLQTLLTPQHLWDERAIFGIKSAVMFEDGSVESESLRHPRFVQGHPRYPLLLPLAEEFVYGWLGQVADRWSKLVSPLSALGLWLVFAGVLERHFGRDRSRLAALLLATVPALTLWEYGYSCVQADAIVASFHGLSVLYLWDACRTPETRTVAQPSSIPRSPWFIAGLAAGFCLFTKDEGIALALVDGVALVVVVILAGMGRHFRNNAVHVVRSAALGWVAWAIPIAVIAGPWFWWRSGLPITNEMTYLSRLSIAGLAAGADRLWWAIPHLMQRMFWGEVATYGLMWWGVIISIILAPRRAIRPCQLLLILDIVGALCGLLIAGMLAPLSVQDHIGGSSHRFLLQLIPTAVLFIMGQVGSSSNERGSAKVGEI